MPSSLLPRRLARRLVVLALLACAISGVAFPTGRASAHNTLVSSEPAAGAVLDSSPLQIEWVFDSAVPLETMTVTLIDPTGVRSELSGSVHGSAGETQVITPLPDLGAGEVSVRWRLVSADGHPITGRVDFTITGTGSELTDDGLTDAGVADGAGSDAAVDTAVVAVDPEIDPAVDTEIGDDGAFSLPSPIRWSLRYGSYLAIMAVIGIVLTSALVWPGAGSLRPMRRILSWSLVAIAVAGAAQLLVVASDVSGAAPWSSFGSIDAAITTDAGLAFLIRVVLALVLWVVLFQYRLDDADVYWSAVAIPGLGLLATWAFAGHGGSVRWPTVGVLTDVAHHGAAAVWIAGLAIVGWIVIPRASADVMVPALRSFSRVAAVSVAVLVVTGLIQTWRLVGSPANLFDADHGRYLAVKVAALAVMLLLANLNRRRLAVHLDDRDSLSDQMGRLRTAVVAEFAIGLVIVAITAAMVVSPPAMSEFETGAASTGSTAVYYTM